MQSILRNLDDENCKKVNYRKNLVRMVWLIDRKIFSNQIKSCRALFYQPEIDTAKKQLEAEKNRQRGKQTK